MAEYIMRVCQYLKDQKGQGLVEYALILVLVSIVAIVALGGVGDQVVAVFNNITNGLKN